MIGTILGGRYEIIEVVGSGGMAIVYKAMDKLLDRFVAVKMLREELQHDKEFVERFKAEARSAASLNHPNVVSVFDVGTDDDREYFVMEYIEGITLKEIIDEKGMSWKTACSYGVQIAGAIEHAHRKNIVHRDIKPHNIMITADKVVKVTDFGIARAVTSSTIVRAGNVIGSVHYFSPEQASGGVVDFKSDIYAMGVVLYEMLTGKVPFDAENPVAIAKMHVDNPVLPPIEINPEIPESVNDIVLKAMAKQPSKRYQKSEELAADLKKVIANPESVSVKDGDATQFIPVVKPSGTVVNDDVKKVVIVAEQPENKRKNTAVVIAWIVAGIVLLASLGVVMSAFFPSMFGLGRTVTVPELRGMTLEEAKAVCLDKGFELDEVAGDFSSEYGEGRIMEQDPVPGMYEKAETIVVKISKGSEKITLKDYTGKESYVVKNELRKLGIDVIIEEIGHDTLPVDTVVKQAPGEGSIIRPGETTVTLYVSNGKEKTKVPNITGISKERAERALEAVGLEVGTIIEIEVESASKVGVVIEQTIMEGTEVERGEQIDIKVGVAKKASNDTGDSGNDSGHSSTSRPGTSNEHNSGSSSGAVSR